VAFGCPSEPEVLALGEVVSDSYLFEVHEEVLDSVLTEQSSRTPLGEHSSVPSFLSFSSSSTVKDFISDAEAFK
jgi:hypothetical protein